MSTSRSTSALLPLSAFTLTSTSSRSTVSVPVKSITFRTGTSLFSCLRICSMIWSFPEVMMVIRETFGSVVSATQRDSMLNPRPENSPATRLNTPNSFSTSTAMVWRIAPSPPSDQQHLRQRRPRGDHRVYHLPGVDHHVDQHGAFRREPLLQHLRYFLLLRGPEPLRAVRLGQPDEVRCLGRQARLGIFPLEEQFLPLPDHPQRAVVEDDHLHGDAVLHRGRHLLDVHLDASVPRDVDHEPVRHRHLRADRGG